MEEYPWNPRIVDGKRLPRKLKKRLQKENAEILEGLKPVNLIEGAS